MTDKNARRSVDWDIKNAGKNYVSLIIAQGFLAIFSFGCVWIIARYLGVEPYGNITAFFSASQLAQVSLWWTANAMLRFGVQEFVETGKISNSFWTRSLILAVNILLVVVTYPLWMPILAHWFKLPDEIIPVTIVYLVVTALWMHIQFAMQTAKIPITLAFGQMFERFITLAGICILAFYGALNWQRAALIYVTSSILILFFGLYKIRSLVNWKFWQIEYKFSLIKDILIFSIPIPLYSLISPLALNYIGSIFIINYMSKSDLGVYAVAYQLYGLIMVLPTLAGSLMTPLFVSSKSAADSERISGLFLADSERISGSFLNEVLPLSTTLFAIGNALLVTLIYCILPFFFGESFADVGKLLWILTAAGVAATPILIGYFPFSMSGNSTFMQLIPAALSSAVLVLASFWLVPRFGLIGSAWATVISFAVNTTVFGLMVHRKEKLGFPKVLFSIIPNVLGALAITLDFNVIWGLLIASFAAGIVFLFGWKYHVLGLAKLGNRISLPNFCKFYIEKIS